MAASVLEWDVDMFDIEKMDHNGTLEEEFEMDLLDMDSKYMKDLPWKQHQHIVTKGHEHGDELQVDEEASFSSSSSHTITEEVKRVHVNYRKRKKEEMVRLRKQIGQLEQERNKLKCHKDSHFQGGTTPWAKLARVQYCKRQEASIENSKLKMAVEEQARFARSLMSLITKSPKPMVMPSAEHELWKMYILPKVITLRHMAMHNIMDREYANLDSALVEAGLYDTESGNEFIRPSLASQETMQSFDMFYFQTFQHISKSKLASSVWNLWSGDFKVNGYNGNYTKLEQLDENTVYCEAYRTTGRLIHAKYILKKYVDTENGRIVIIWRSILEDNLCAHENGFLKDDKTGYVIIKQSSNTATPETSIKLYFKYKTLFTEEENSMYNPIMMETLKATQLNDSNFYESNNFQIDTLPSYKSAEIPPEVVQKNFMEMNSILQTFKDALHKILLKDDQAESFT